MLGKLLKYDLKWCYKPLIVFYGLSIFFAIVTRIINQFDNSFIFMILSKIFTGVVIAMIINILINNFMRVWARVTRNLYKDESYLTHTIPVSKNLLFTSKVLTAIITMITSTIVIIATLAISYLTKDSWQIIKEAIEGTAVFFNSSVGGFIAVVIATVFFEMLFLVIAGILGIVIGYRSNNMKSGKSILIGFIIYSISSSLSLALIYCMGLINPEIMNLFNSTTEITTEALKAVLYGAIGIYIVYDLIYYFIGCKILNKGVNV